MSPLDPCAVLVRHEGREHVAPSWYAATGARQPPPRSATHRRSASTRRRVSASSTERRGARHPPALGAPARLDPLPAEARRARTDGRSRRRGRAGRARTPPSTTASSPRSPALAQAGVDVSAQRLDREGRLERQQLGPPANGRRSRSSSRGAAPQPHRARPVGPRARCRHRRLRPSTSSTSCPSPSARPRRCAGEERLLQLLDEHASGADLPEGARSITVSGGGHRYEGDLDARPAERLDRLLGLRQREPTTARPDAQQHGSGAARRCGSRRTRASTGGECARRRSAPAGEAVRPTAARPGHAPALLVAQPE